MKTQWELNGVKCFLFALGILLCLPPAVRATQVVYVLQGTLNNTQDGTSWATAYSDLGRALGVTSGGTADNPVEFWISTGTYTPEVFTNSVYDYREATFELSSHWHLFGGFQGTETSKSQRGNIENAYALTVLSGDIGIPEQVPATGNLTFSQLQEISVNTQDAGSLDNCYNVLTGNNVTDVILDHLVIFGGMATASTNEILQADIVAMSQVLAIPTDGSDAGVDNTYAERGETIAEMDYRVIGGGVNFQQAPGWPLNNAPDLVTTNLTVNDCVFVANLAEGYGGAIGVTEAKVQVNNSYFYNNESGYEGGAYYGLDQLVNFYQCNFSKNTAVRSGGAVHLEMLPSLRTLIGNLDDSTFYSTYGVPKSQPISTLQHFQGQVNNGLDAAEAAVEVQNADTGASDGFDSSVTRITGDAQGLAQFVATYF